MENFVNMAKKFCEARLLTINFDKSDIVVSGVPRPPKILFGFPLRKTAKYLGVTYDGKLSIKKSLTAFEKKEQFVFIKLYRVLKMTDFRTRYNLWQVFINPLFRMVISLAG